MRNTVKSKLLILLISLSPLIGFAEHGEKTHTFDTNEFILKNYIKSFETVLNKRVDRYNREGLKWLQTRTKTKSDKNLIKTQIARGNVNALSTIQKRDHYWVMKVANHKVSFSSADILLNRVYVDGTIFELKRRESLEKFQKRLLHRIRAKNKRTSFLDFFISPAHAQFNKKRVEEIVVLNATGVISISYDEPWWFEIPEYAKDLALAMSEEINRANKECTQKSQELARWDTRRRGKGLIKIVNSLKTNGKINHAKLISSLMKKFSTKNKVDEETVMFSGSHKALNGSCEDMMFGWKIFPQTNVSPTGNGQTYKDWVTGNAAQKVDAKTGLCSAVKQTVSCLEGLEAIESSNIANNGSASRVKEIEFDSDSSFDEVNGSNENTRAK